jgi:hypothetical protein
MPRIGRQRLGVLHLLIEQQRRLVVLVAAIVEDPQRWGDSLLEVAGSCRQDQGEQLDPWHELQHQYVQRRLLLDASEV